MGYFIVENNGMPLSGQVDISGAKNAALPILAACVLCESVRLDFCPDLSDTHTALEILSSIGYKYQFENNKAEVSVGDKIRNFISSELCSKMRSSIIFMAPLALRCGRAVVYSPGGCCLGERPIDLHISALQKMGAEITLNENEIIIEAENGFCGADISLRFPSVGATETIILAACCAKGITRIFNPALEPEIEDLCNFLCCAGAKINFGKIIEIEGVERLNKNVEYKIMPDRIEAGTFLIAAAMTGGELFIKNAVPSHLTPLIQTLEQMGCIIKQGRRDLYIDAPIRLNNPEKIITAPYPLMPTDLQPQLTALFAAKSGVCRICESVFEGRHNHIPQLNKMGADIKIENSQSFVINGINMPLKSAEVCATDLRCGAALVLAALTVDNGAVKINNGNHILRGYENICKKMELIGAKMQYNS